MTASTAANRAYHSTEEKGGPAGGNLRLGDNVFIELGNAKTW